MHHRKLTASILTAGMILSVSACSKPVTETSEVTVPTTTAETSETAVTEALAPVIQPREPEVFDEPAIDAANADNFATLLTDLVYTYENPSGSDEETINQDLEAIREVSGADYEIACSVADNWQAVFIDPSYTLNYYQGEDNAPEVALEGIPNSASHAIVILGYELSDGGMQPELIGRLDTAASLAHAYPETLIVCSGGATGVNNTSGNTEAGLMRDYLVEECGIDPARVFTDERAMTTAENAINTFAMLRENDVHSITIVTSGYHMKWGQAVYNVVAALYSSRVDYDIVSISNYCYDTEPEYEIYRLGDRFAAHQIGEILGLPESALQSIPSVFN